MQNHFYTPRHCQVTVMPCDEKVSLSTENDNANIESDNDTSNATSQMGLSVEFLI